MILAAIRVVVTAVVPRVTNMEAIEILNSRRTSDVLFFRPFIIVKTLAVIKRPVIIIAVESSILRKTVDRNLTKFCSKQEKRDNNCRE